MICSLSCCFNSTDHIKSDNSEQSATHQQVTHNTLPEDESQQTEQPEIQSTKDADETVYPESTTEAQQSKTQSAVETTTERANHDEQHDGELKLVLLLSECSFT